MKRADLSLLGLIFSKGKKFVHMKENYAHTKCLKVMKRNIMRWEWAVIY